MNLVAKEFLDCQRPEFSERPGVLILSEFAGAAQELVPRDPGESRTTWTTWRPHSTARSKCRMTSAAQRIDMMQPRLRKQDSGVWARRFLKDLDKVPNREERASIMELKPLAATLATRVTRRTKARLVPRLRRDPARFRGRAGSRGAGCGAARTAARTGQP